MVDAAVSSITGSGATSRKYLALSILAHARYVSISTDTHFSRWASRDRVDEVRTPSIANTSRRWAWFREAYETVDTQAQLRRFIRMGGHAMVDASLAKTQASEL